MQTEQTLNSVNLRIIKPRKALNKAYLKVKPNRSQIESFKAHLIQLLDRTNDTESEEFHKNLVTDFLKKTYYEPDHFINTKGRTDLVIHNGNKAKSTVGVIIEAKKPTNRAEMLSKEKINVKAFQELVLYYLRERITHNNLEVKYVVATNINEWYIFDANVFEKAFAQNKKLVSQFKDFEEGRLAGKTTDFFYKEIAEPFIAGLQQEVEFTHFDIRNYEKPVRNNNPKDDNKLITLYKLLSPEHLLKLPFSNDSNSLDRRFYGELLHIIGLTETRQKGKKLIERPKEGERNSGSLLENAIVQLDSMDKIGRLENPSHFGDTKEERLFSVGLELSITWLNRILFMKLLEAQLITYHKGDRSYEFLNYSRIRDYDDLNKLFFQVLARRYEERNEDVRQIYDKVPYLNSSLFEPTDIEHSTLFIGNLEDGRKLPVYSATVLKDKKGKKLKGELNALEYLFEFLNAYDFSSEGGEEIQEDNKTLINASVLGLIFEKINGYKDGSFFTPGFITMYMCRETIRKAVVQKFNENKGWDCKDLDELYDRIEDRKEANELINSLKICDPAVGSGHFLVSALNEIIAIKNDLNILQDRSGRRLKEYQVEVVNDELIVTDEDGELFEYNPTSKESQRVQEALFHEKQQIIENCLFGVDINANSVKICRLRLWIELLKNAYYKNETELETLPNIDINIKCGNSLISRFDLDADLRKALKDSKWSIDSYRNAVDTYRNAENKEQKREMEQLIHDIKSDFRSEISANDPKIKKLQKIKSELFLMTEQPKMFELELSRREKTKWNKKVEKLKKDSKKLEAEIEEIKDNKIYENAFEWRFEFPEVLDDNGDYIGFNVVIGNPPYIRIQDLVSSHNEAVDFYNKHFLTAGKGNYDLYVPFVEKGIELIKDLGSMCYIMPHKFINANYGKPLKGFIGKRKLLNKMVHFGAAQIFEDATTYTGLFFLSKKENSTVSYANLESIDKFRNGILPDFNDCTTSLLTAEQWIFLDPKEAALLKKLQGFPDTLETKTSRIFQGVKTSADKIFIVEKLHDNGDLTEIYCRQNERNYLIEKRFLLPLIKGGNSRPYKILSTDLLLLFPYENGRLLTSERIKKDAIKTWNYLNDHKNTLEARENNSFQGPDWYRFGRSQALIETQKEKIFTPDIAPSPRFSFDENGENAFTGGAAGGYGILPNEKSDFQPLLAILNSKVAFWFISKISTQMRGGWYSFESKYIKHIPIPDIDIPLKEKICYSVAKMLDTKKENPAVYTSTLEAEIDRLVYELYGLTEEEIEIVENSLK